MKYFVVDYGKEVEVLAKRVITTLKSDGCHIAIYITDADYLLQVEEVGEDEFLKHFKNTNK